MARKTDPEDLAESAFSSLLHRAVQLAADLHAEISGPGALTPRQHAVLEAVAADEGATQSRLVAATGMDRSTLAELVARLADRGLVSRRRSGTDARANQVHLTGEGRARLEASRPGAAQVDAALLARLPEDRRARFLKDLRRLVAGAPGDPDALPQPLEAASGTAKPAKPAKPAKSRKPDAPAEAGTGGKKKKKKKSR